MPTVIPVGPPRRWCFGLPVGWPKADCGSGCCGPLPVAEVRKRTYQVGDDHQAVGGSHKGQTQNDLFLRNRGIVGSLAVQAAQTLREPEPVATNGRPRRASAKGVFSMGVPRQAGPDESDAPEISQCELPPARHSTRLNESVRIRDLWHVLDRARTDGASRTLAVAQDEVFRRYLPMARTLAAGWAPVTGRVIRPPPSRLPKSVWRRPCSAGGARTATGSRHSPSPRWERGCDVCRPPTPTTLHPPHPMRWTQYWLHAR